jgi:hypothetical protein
MAEATTMTDMSKSRFIGWRRSNRYPRWAGVAFDDGAEDCYRRLERYLACEGGSGLAFVAPRHKSPPTGGDDARAEKYTSGRIGSARHPEHSDLVTTKGYP